MKFDTIAEKLKGIPFTTPERGRQLYDFILENRPKQCLELGFAHGVASCYIAAALDEIGSGTLTCVDLKSDLSRTPSLTDLLKKTRLDQKVDVRICREQSSYNWFLKKEIESRTDQNQNCTPLYDFCFIDGAKNWTIDGLAFFLVDKLLQREGWILFDDLNWSYLVAGHESSDGVAAATLGEDERAEPHIDRIFKLLVMQHPNYSNFKITDSTWAWAQKTESPNKTLSITESSSLTASIMDLIRRGGLRVARTLLTAKK